MDTGSSLLWVQCSPTWYISPRSPIPLLDPLKSSTYASIPCESKLCQYFPHNSCIKEQCYYNITYLKAASSKGNAATEQFIFESLNEDIVAVSQLIFGCSAVVDKYFSTQSNSIARFKDELLRNAYASIPCESKLCQYFPHNSCIKEQCYYNITYLKAASSKGNAATEEFIFESLNEDIVAVSQGMLAYAASSKGNAATEEFIFESLNEDIVAVSQLIFGCSAVVDKYIEQGINGVFGLGPQKISMASQLGNKFSYCIGDFYDPNYNYIQLFLGDGASMDGYATPLEMSEAHYYLNLQGIDIGANELDIDEAVFWRNITDQSKLTGVIIDTGSPATWLIDQAYYRFRNEVRRILSQLAIVPISKCVYCLCFKGNMTQELEVFPDVIYHFSEGADLQVGLMAYFIVFCMAVFPSSQLPDEKFRYITIIGMMAQQNYNVGYDLVAKKLYFQYIDCQLYAD
ncbi:hypothetical protein GH714_028722 [Hevea brasiliensis]|uniref:Peptidase A1 domain-containing protein n=1 Tax=Hevea brasiliensis TaxID=3981 RepID=A0A6A6M191_HEVBR|nr:hypothetical protein GH714_028722 [Hevea brasiliensis]